MWYIATNAQAFHEREEALRAAQERVDQGQDVRLIDGAECLLVVSEGLVSKTRGTE